MSWKSIAVSTEKKFLSGKQAQKDVGNVERYVPERTEKATDTKSGQAAGKKTWILMAVLHDDIVREKTVMIPRPTLSNLPAIEESGLGSTPRSWRW